MILKKILIFILKTYNKIISPVLVNIFGHSCRFDPTCSRYSIEVIERFGLIKGIKLSLIRLSRCHPFSKVDFDPIPN
jgi:putative membrane protein insertion efficiency factor